MRKVILVFLFSIIFTGCKSVESQQTSNSNAGTQSNITKVEETPVEEEIPDLTKEQKQILDKKLPPKVRQILDEADELNVYYDVDKETKELNIFFRTAPNSVAKISDTSLKKNFLDAFYYDASSDDSGAACFSPRHKLTAKSKNKTIELYICYQCSNFTGESSFGHIGGGLSYKSKFSSKLMNEIVEKYGTELK